MSSPRCRPRSPAVKTPLEDDDLLSEILLRLPPPPSSLPRASLVCKRWHGLASDPGFFRRFRRHHRRSPPLLGLFDKHDVPTFVPILEAPDRVPPGRFSLQRGHGDRFMSLGCRHGLVLIVNFTPDQMLVWDPITGDQHRLTIPPGIATHAERTIINGAVLRAGAHFQVVLTVADNQDKQRRRALACVYSSETGFWGDLISTPLPLGVPRSDYPIFQDFAKVPTLVFTGKPAVLAGNSLYWVLAGNFQGILEFDLGKQSLAVIRVPLHMLENDHFWNMRAEGGSLGLLFSMDTSIQLWKMKTDCDGVASWALATTIELDKLLSLESQRVSVIILGYAEENNVLFLWTCGILYMVHLESLQFKKLCETRCLSQYHPFESVYTSETSIGDEHDAADLLQQT
ncbi:uncharacterized protein LOC124671196 [Lolium rigidum]|uniref:uncharacterized protein LOC124671196 n=1 Tax=Lolium rigidum TaxID=89674 RepID=UPI001F5E2BB7|nr:uncharacterized protein LOC124671196 [Lolium rigidum]